MLRYFKVLRMFQKYIDDQYRCKHPPECVGPDRENPDMDFCSHCGLIIKKDD